jgi:hypothetical protein
MHQTVFRNALINKKHDVSDDVLFNTINTLPYSTISLGYSCRLSEPRVFQYSTWATNYGVTEFLINFGQTLLYILVIFVFNNIQ